MPMFGFLRRVVHSVAGEANYARLRRRLRRSHLAAWPIRKDLRALARFYGSDKWGAHRYAAHYQQHFGPLRRDKLTILEIGVGGYRVPYAGGESLRMWKRFFPRARVYAIDIFDKSPLNEDRIRIFQGSQDDPVFLRSVVDAAGPFDIIVDDGSHVNAHVLASFEFLFPHLRSGGWYVIEDLQTSYWPDFGGSEDPLAADTGIALCKRIADGLNWEEFRSRPPGRFDAEITAIHLYHNLALIKKGDNREASLTAPSRPPCAERGPAPGNDGATH